MRTRTPDEFDDFIDGELAWRRKELIDYHLLASGTEGALQRTLCRAGVALAYAHWEGFTKHGCDAYVEYVARRKLLLRELADPFAMLAVGKRVTGAQGSTAMKEVMRITLLRTAGAERLSLPKDQAVDTQSNLSSEVLCGIYAVLGLDPSPLAQKFNLIDRNLLPTRNAIAHGRETAPSFREYEDLHSHVLDMLNIVANQLRNAVHTAAYRNPPNA